MTEPYPGGVHAYQAGFLSGGEHRQVGRRPGPGNRVAINAVGSRGEQQSVPGRRRQFNQAGGEHRAEPIGQR
jgi:hypothetical protein